MGDVVLGIWESYDFGRRRILQHDQAFLNGSGRSAKSWNPV